MGQKHGSFAWHDCMTLDVDAAIDYYGRVLGLGTAPFDADYIMWTAGGVPIGGVMKLPDEAQAMGAPPHWLSYMNVDSVDETTAKAKALGAKAYVEPTDIPGGGKFAVLADPQGATFGIHAYAEAPPAEQTPELEFTWHELATTDWSAAWKFYQELFGWEETDSMDMGEGNLYHMFGFGGQSMGGMYNKPADMPAPPNWLPYADVKDADALAKTATDHGGKILNGPMEVPGGGRIVMIADPQGAAFAVYESPTAVAAQKPEEKPESKAEPKARTVRKKATTVAARKRPVKKAAKKKTKRAGRKKRR